MEFLLMGETSVEESGSDARKAAEKLMKET